jgi:hypothetical protein
MSLSYFSLLPRDVLLSELAPLLTPNDRDRASHARDRRSLQSWKAGAFVLLVLSVALFIAVTTLAWPQRGETIPCEPLVCDWIPATAYPWMGDPNETSNTTGFCGGDSASFWQPVIGNLTGDLWPRGLFDIPLCCKENSTFCIYYSTEPPYPNGTICYNPHPSFCQDGFYFGHWMSWMFASWYNDNDGGKFEYCLPVLQCTPRETWTYRCGRLIFIVLSSLLCGFGLMGVAFRMCTTSNC